MTVDSEEKSNEYKALRVRMPPLELKFLDSFCEMIDQSRSQTVRTAIKSYIYRNIDNKKRPNKKLIFSQNMLKPLINNADWDVIEEIAEISFQNGVSDHRCIDNLLDILNKGSTTAEYTLDLEGRVKSLIENVFSPFAQNWFESIKYGWNRKNVIIGGKHNLGPKFSLFIKLLLNKYMKIYNYELKTEEYREGKSEETNDTIYTIIYSFGPIRSPS